MTCPNIVTNDDGFLEIKEVVHKGCLKPITQDGLKCQCQNITKCLDSVKRKNDYRQKADFYNMINEIAYHKEKKYPESTKDGQIIEFDPEVFLYSMGMHTVFDYKEREKQPIETLYLNTGYVKLGRSNVKGQPKQRISRKLEEGIKSGTIPTLKIDLEEKGETKESNTSRLQKKLKALGGKVPVLEMEIK